METDKTTKLDKTTKTVIEFLNKATIKCSSLNELNGMQLQRDFFINDNLQSLGEAKDQIISFMGEATYKVMIEEFQKFDLASLAMGDFQSKTIGGFIIALVVATILKQKPPIFDASDE